MQAINLMTIARNITLKVRNTFSIEFIIQILIASGFLIIVFNNFNRTWDDSAITIGFSKNLYLYNDISPGRYSERVEGYSSFLWMIINYIFFYIGLAPNTVLLTSKVLGMVINIGSIFLFTWILKKHIKNMVIVYFGVCLLVFSSVMIYESINGMETPLYVLLTLIAYSNYGCIARSNKILFVIATTLIILTRHEAIWILIPFVINDFRQHRMHLFKKHYYSVWLLVFSAYTLWHYLYFDEFLTNPIIAKSNLPYSHPISDFSNFSMYHLLPLTGIWVYFIGFIFLRNYKNIGEVFNSNIQFGTMKDLVILSIIFNLFIGLNMGPTNRMFFPAIPFIILLLSKVFDEKADPIKFKKWILFTIPIFIIYNLKIVDSKGQITPVVNDIIKKAEFISDIQKFQNKVIYAGSDSGAVLLFSDNIRLVDTALLCNKYLSKNGFGNFDNYVFKTEQVDIFETHTLWTNLSNVKNSKYLYNEYQLFIFKNNVFFVNSKAFSKIPKNNLIEVNKEVEKKNVAVIDGLESYSNTDFEIFNKFKTWYKLLI